MDVVRLVRKAKKGNKEALLYLIMSEKDVYFRLAFNYMGNANDTMDAMEEMIVTLYEKIDQLKKEEAFYSWSKTILVNGCKKLLQNRGKIVLLEDWSNVDDRELDQAVSSDPFRRSEQQIDIETLLLHVNEHQKEAIQLKYFHDLDYQTIADITKVSIGTVKSRIYQGIDANQFIMYYTLTNPNGLEDMSVDAFRPSKISGFLTDSNVVSGTSLINEDHTEIKGTMSFDSVNPFSKKITLHFWQQLEENGQMSEGTVTFPYNPNEAMQTQIKQSIHKKIKVDKGTITFKSITATPTMTVIKGKLDVENFDRVNLGLHGVQLIVNGTPVEILGSGSQSSFGGRTFDIRFDTLPKDLHSLQLVVKEFAGYQKLEEKYPMTSIRISHLYWAIKSYG
nr:sigma-70 family RNA polymerase sigma factor [Paenibacillus sp.]